MANEEVLRFLLPDLLGKPQAFIDNDGNFVALEDFDFPPNSYVFFISIEEFDHLKDIKK